MNGHRRIRGQRRGQLGARLCGALLLTLAALVVTASAAMAGPLNRVYSIANTTAAPGGTHSYYVSVLNAGDAPMPDSDLDGIADEARVLTVDLPSGITATGYDGFQWDCSATDFSSSPSTVSCTNPNVADTSAFRVSSIRIDTAVDAGATGTKLATFTVTGGSAEPAGTVDETVMSATPPEFGIDAFDGQVTANAAGDPSTQAGGHPYEITTSIFFNTLTNPLPSTGSTWPVEPTKSIQVDLPPGFVGAPTATGDGLCTLAQLSNGSGTIAKPLCPPGSQVGVAVIFSADGVLLDDTLPVFNLVAPPDAPARFGMNAAGTIVSLDAKLRSGGDYGLSVNVNGVSELAIAGTKVTFWGVPADQSHDLIRACPGQVSPGTGGSPCKTEAPRRAFLRNPTSCTPASVGLETRLSIDSWDDPGDFKSAAFTSHAGPGYPFPIGATVGIDGCADVPFDPTFSGAPTNLEANAPSGYTFDLKMPQNDDPDAIGTADLKRVTTVLPLGVRVSPSSAAGLGACDPAHIALNSPADATCPKSSKIGNLRIETPLIDQVLTGSIFLAKPKDNPFGSLLSIYLVAKGAGLVVKLPGQVNADPITGQLTATFDDNPQLPFSLLHLEFFGGDQAALVNPASCGTYTTHAELTSWSGKTVVSDSTFDISRDGVGAPCGASQFTPKLEAGVNDVKAGKNTSFSLRLSRDDDDEEIKSLTVRMPKGLLAKVAGVPLCDADTAGKAGTCGEASRIGDVLTGAGAGDNPFYLPGRAYLTDAYNGGPFGLSIVVPAVAGPFDLGTVVVQTSLRLNRRTSQLSVVSDPLPEVLEGIRLQIRDVRVTVNRSKFMVNPTSCLEKAVQATVGSTAGKTANVSTRFQVGGCSKLKLRPKLTLTVGGKGHTRAGSSTPLTAKLTQSAGQSNLKSVNVTLPLSLNALLTVVQDACTEAEFDAGNCEASKAGTAVAVTPLLDKPLKGSAYFVKDPNRPRGSLPNLVVALRGQVDFDLVGRIVIPNSNALSTRFETVPDVPIKSFTLRLSGGKDGAIGVAENLCTKKSKRAKAAVVFSGQNGALVRSSQRLKIRGCKK